MQLECARQVSECSLLFEGSGDMCGRDRAVGADYLTFLYLTARTFLPDMSAQAWLFYSSLLLVCSCSICR
jgi:hypothetical protein